MRIFISNIRNLPSWVFVSLYLLFIVCYTFIIGLQGINIKDEGWICTGFQQIYNDADSISGMFTMYNTLLAGGIFHLLFPSMGMIAFRLASALCLTTTAYVVYIMLKESINRWWILLGIFICITNSHCVSVLHYNYTSSLVVALIALFLYRAVMTNKSHYMIIAGIITGIGVFFRMPNVCLCGMIAVLIPYYLYNKSLRQTISFLGYGILGALIGVSINIGIIFLLNHQEPFGQMLTTAFSYLTKTDSSHNSLGLLNTYVLQTRSLLTFVAIFLAFPIIDYFAYKKIRSKWLTNCLRILLILLFIWKLKEKFYMVILLYAFCSIGLVYNLLSQSNNRKIVYLSSLALLSMLLLPIGSDNGFYNVGANAMYLAIPLTLGTLFTPDYPILKNDTYISVYKKYIVVFLAYVFATAFYCTLTYCDHDSGLRFHKTARPTKTVAKTTYTTAYKAAQIDSLFVHLMPLVDENTYLLAYSSIPAINYLSQTNPYLSDPWVGIMDYNTYYKSFEYAKKNKPLPVIVVSKATDKEWSVEYEQWHSILDCVDYFPSQKEKNEYLYHFVSDNNYIVAWENNLFQILAPPDLLRCE